MSVRYKLVLEYDGTSLVGWQRQDNGLSVQAILEDAIRAFSGENVTAFAAGRTDAGVHALAQVVHMDLVRQRPADTVRDALNAHLRPRAVAVLSAAPVHPTFHARFDAVQRRYRYRIITRRSPLTVDRGRAWHVPVPLDRAAMAAAAANLVGHHDFSSFRAADCQAPSPVKTLDALEVSGDGDEIRIEAGARSFLHSQVRILVGTLKAVGEGRLAPADMFRILAARDRAAAGATAPPDGLYLLSVRYP